MCLCFPNLSLLPESLFLVSGLHFQLFSGYLLMDFLQVSQINLSRIEHQTQSHPDTWLQLPQFLAWVNSIIHQSVSQTRNLGAILPLNPPQLPLLSPVHTHPVSHQILFALLRYASQTQWFLSTPKAFALLLDNP